MKHCIELSERTLLLILLNGLEAFTVQHRPRKRSGIEMYGHFFGSTEQEKPTIYRHRVELFNPDTSALMMPDSCQGIEQTEILKRDLAYCFSRYNLLGSLHTHPYLNTRNETRHPLNWVRTEGSQFSDIDLNSTRNSLSASGHDYALEGILTVTNQPRQTTTGNGKRDDNLFEFSIGNLVCLIRFQAFSLDDDENLVYEHTVLECPYLERSEHLDNASDFGKIKIKPGKKRILQYQSQLE